MKKIIILGLCSTLLSCNKWKKDKNGNEYYINRKCIESHIVPTISYMYINKILYPTTNYINICDAYRLDTIWKKDINSHKKD